ncbi:signal peptidase I, partial [candidate division WOR-3 bacterium]|nr:signal peptidase I [candidate division WOR-3 bacterium]
MKSPVPLSNSNLLKLCDSLSKRGTSIRFQAKGFSMRPFIQDGDLITVSPLRDSPVRVGDVVLYKTADDQAIVHRVIQKTRIDSKVVFFIKGDATFGQPEKVDLKNILGRVTAIKRNGGEIKLGTKLYRIIGLLFAGLSPFSRWIYPAGSKIRSVIIKKRRSIWTNEDRLLLYCCRTKKANFPELRDMNWNIFLEKARGEGISPLVFLRLPEIVINKDAIPKYVTEELKEDYYLNAARNALIFKELGKALETFRKAGLQVIVMKGAALAEAVYGNLALRPMADVDLLVKKETLRQVDELL